MAIKLSDPRLYLGANSAAIETFHIAGGIACAFTLRAPVKESDNEDSLGLIPCGENTCVLVVADGMGGLPSGDQASATAVQQASERLAQHSNEQQVLRDAILDGIEHANEMIMDHGMGSGTTIAAISVERDYVRPYHVGDSAILITGQRGKIKYQTIPHSPVGYAVEAELIEADEAIYHEERHLVSNMLGTRRCELKSDQASNSRHAIPSLSGAMACLTIFRFMRSQILSAPDH